MKSYHHILWFYKMWRFPLTKNTIVPNPFWSCIIIFCNFTSCEDFHDKITMELKPFSKPYYDILRFCKMWRFSWQNHNGARGFWSRIIIFCDFTSCEYFHDKITRELKCFWSRIIIFCDFTRCEDFHGAKGFLKSYFILLWF